MAGSQQQAQESQNMNQKSLSSHVITQSMFSSTNTNNHTLYSIKFHGDVQSVDMAMKQYVRIYKVK